MKSLKFAAVVCATLSTAIGAQPIRYAKVAWPERIAVGVIRNGQIPPIAVEATKNGWVSISFVVTGSFAGLLPPPFRMMAEASEVKQWSAWVRRMMESPTDSGARSTRRELGNGAFGMWIDRGYRAPQSYTFSWRACGSGVGTAGPSAREVLDLLALLDSAATVAGGGEGRPPTLSRPYYATESSCPAVADASNKIPRVPFSSSVPLPTLGAQFVVDTSGRVEPRSIAFLPGANKALTKVTRAAIRGWTYRPGEIDGTPVRQIVQTTIAFEPTWVARVGDDSLGIEPTADGWVRVYRMSAVAGPVQQWFHPDSLDAWIARVWGRRRLDDPAPIDTAQVLTTSFLLGTRDGSMVGSVAKTRERLQMSVTFNGCSDDRPPGRSMGYALPLIDAARTARARHYPPVDVNRRTFQDREVACPASLLWDPSRRRAFENAWKYPVAPYPESMRKTNARAEVLVSFVVDTAGHVDPRTIAVMPGSDPRAVAVIPAAIRLLRFRPAVRSGHLVRQRVIQTLRFEPPPNCLTKDASPACARRYSKD